MTWYYLPCGSCNRNGSFSNVNPNCQRCSGTGNDWDEGESGRERLRSIYGKEPKTGKPPSHNLAGGQVYSGTCSSDEGSRASAPSKKRSPKVYGVMAAIALFGAGLHLNGQLTEGGAKLLLALAMGIYFLMK